ncbi:hypothetical protein AB0H71_18730 [Nocardia sp. NPDC050697]|uniref:hypothetical protein n=1 Tax=Nocardia sp. NPDC050697 TaxID=3155158 RepID=UPI00340B3F57
MRKSAPETDNGWPRVRLPDYSVESSRAVIKNLEIAEGPYPMGAAVSGSHWSVRNPNNSGRIRRAV